MLFVLQLAALTAIFWGSLLQPEEAEGADFQRNTLSYLAGDGYATGEAQRNIISFDTINKSKRGLIYLNVDLQGFTGSKSYQVSRVLGHFGDGFHLAGQLQNSTGYSNTNVGAGYSYFAGSGFFGVDVYRRSDNLRGDGGYVFAFGRYAITDRISLDGFVDISVPDRGQQQWLAQPSIMYHFDKSFSVGIEQQLYLNKGYVNGVDESVPQLKLTYGW